MPASKPPKVIVTWLGEGETEESMKEYLQRSVEMYHALGHKDALDKIGWIAFKLSCTRKQAEHALRWAGLTFK
jgi:hypothetical protein